MIYKIDLKSNSHAQMIDITQQVAGLVGEEKIVEGWVEIYSPHTTAGITINENADPDVQKDLLRRLDGLCPWYMPEDRHLEGNSAAHLKASILGTSQRVMIEEGKLLLGPWQGIYFCEFDGPRSRNCYVQIIKGK